MGTKVYKSDYTKRSFKVKDVYETHPTAPGGLDLEKGHVSQKIETNGYGTSKKLLKDDSSGNVPKKKDMEY